MAWPVEKAGGLPGRGHTCTRQAPPNSGGQLISLGHVFGMGGDSVPRGTFGNGWRQLWLSLRGWGMPAGIWQ